MLKDLLTNRLLLGAFVCLVLIVVGGVLYLKHAERQTLQELTSTEEAIKPSNERQNPTADTGGETEQGGHWHGDEWHAAPHTEETPQEKFDREMMEKYERRLQQTVAKYKADNEAIRAELKALKERDAELLKYLTPIRAKGAEITSTYADVLTMTPEKYVALSAEAQDAFLLQCVEYDLDVAELQHIVTSTPKWVLDIICEGRRPGLLDSFLNAPSATLIYRNLQ